MTVKDRIKQRVDDINDPQLLEELLKAADLEYEIEHSKELSIPEKKAINEGIEGAESGRLYSNAQASKLVKEWY